MGRIFRGLLATPVIVTAVALGGLTFGAGALLALAQTSRGQDVMARAVERLLGDDGRAVTIHAMTGLPFEPRAAGGSSSPTAMASG